MTNILKLSGSKNKKSQYLFPSIANITNAIARKDKEWRAYSDAQRTASPAGG